MILAISFFGFVGLLAGIGGAAAVMWLSEVIFERSEPPPKDEFRWKYVIPWSLSFFMVVAWLASLLYVDPFEANLAFMAASVVGLGIGLHTAHEELSLLRHRHPKAHRARDVGST